MFVLYSKDQEFRKELDGLAEKRHLHESTMADEGSWQKSVAIV